MEPESEEPKPEPATEILFLCSYESCSKAFSTEIAYRKHSYTHGEKQHGCTFPGCRKVIHAFFWLSYLLYDYILTLLCLTQGV